MINPYGDTIWTSFIDSLRASDGISTGDGGYIFVSEGYSVKLNASGETIWKKYYQFNPINVYKVIKTEINNYAVCGRAYYNSGLILTLDSLGNLLWVKQYPSPNYKIFYTICKAHNGGFVAAGYYDTSMSGIGGGVVTRVDESGELIWEKVYYFSQYNFSEIFAIHQIDGGYIFLPHSYSDFTINRKRAAIVKIDTAGNLNYIKILPDDTNRTLLMGDLEIINSNRYLICGSIADSAYDTINARIYITDSSSNILQKGLFHETSWCSFSQSYVKNDNDILFIGSSDFLQPNEFYNTYVVRTDTNFHAPPIGIIKENKNLPVNFQLYQNYPNPFNPSTKIRFSIPFNKGGKRGLFVQLKIFDILGREVTVLVNKQLQPGNYDVEFDGTKISSGIYFYQLKSGDVVISKKMVLLK
jgi:hypothetical protein